MIVDKLERWTLELDRYEIVMLRSVLSYGIEQYEKGDIDDAEVVAFIEQLEKELADRG